MNICAVGPERLFFIISPILGLCSRLSAPDGQEEAIHSETEQNGEQNGPGK